MEEQTKSASTATTDGPGHGSLPARGPSPRTLSPKRIGELLGREKRGAWACFGKRQVVNWCSKGFGEGVCPHTRITGRGGQEELRLNLEEVIAWRRSVGMEVVERGEEGTGDKGQGNGAGAGLGACPASLVPAVSPASEPTLAEAAAASKRETAEHEARREAARVEAVLAAIRGDPVFAVRRLLMEARLRLESLNATTSAQTLQQLTGSLKNIGQEIRLLDELERAKAESSGRLVDRNAAGKVLTDQSAAFRQSFTAIGPEVVAAVAAGLRAAGVEPPSGEVFERVAAVEVQRVIDDALDRVAEGGMLAARELEGEGKGIGIPDEGPARVGAGAGGLFKEAA